MDEIASRKKVLLISPEFGFGGSEKSIANLSVLLAPNSEVHFVVFNVIKVSPQYKFKGQLHSLEVPAANNLLAKIFAFFKRVRRLRKLKKDLNVHASISFLEGADYVNVLSRQSEKVIVSIRGSKKFDPNIRGLFGSIRHRVLIPWVYSHADLIVVVAEGIKKELRTLYHVKEKVPIHVIGNFYDPAELQTSASETISPDWLTFFTSNKVLVAVGRLAKEKGFHNLIDVAAELKQAIPSIKLLLIGSGPYQKVILDRISGRKLKVSTAMESPDFSADVIMTGFLKNPLKYVARSALFVLSSQTEGFPNAMVEAMSLGVPVAANDCPYGPSEILSNPEDPELFKKFGLLLPQLSVDTAFLRWKDAIVKMLRDDKLLAAYAHSALERSQEYTPEKALALWRKAIG